MRSHIPPLDRETIFQLVSKKDWKELIDIFKDNKKYNFVITDPVLNPFLEEHFIAELLNGSSIKADPAYKYYLTNFYMLNESVNYTFKLSASNFQKLIVKFDEVEPSLEQAYHYALKFPENELCKQVIEQYQIQKPKIVTHSQEHSVVITENRNISSVDARISLFKSKQEYNFYRAVREVFPSFLVFPNVALTAIIDFNLIKEGLTQEERSYFFKALIDCVVIDSENSFIPIKFVELDSPFHDNERQKQKDLYKDNILSAAGQKLIRIRQITLQEEETDLIKLIREAIR